MADFHKRTWRTRALAPLLGFGMCSMLLVTREPVAAQVPTGRLVASASMGAIVSDAGFGVMPFASARAAYRFGKDFSVLAEIAKAADANPAPAQCRIDACADLFNGDREVRMWHIGMETRLLPYRESASYRIMAEAGVGQRQLRVPNARDDAPPTLTSSPSVHIGAALEFPIFGRLLTRLAATGYASTQDNAQGGLLSNLWEIAGATAGVTYVF